MDNNSGEDVAVINGDSLPPEVWVGVMQFLPFDTVLSCSATSRSILHNAIPQLETIHIDKAKQMNLTVAKRFRDITEIHINSLFKVTIEDDDDFLDMSIDMESKLRIIPFLLKFDKLDRVVFGGKDEADGSSITNFSSAACYFWEGDEGYPNDGPRDSMKAFLDMMSGAFGCDALPKHLQISGLCCPDTDNRGGNRSNNCQTCMRAVKSFPLQAVAEFECRGSSKNQGRSGRRHGLDVCLEKAQLESLIESRSGSELLRSENRLLRLLGRGRRYTLPSDDGKVLYIVKYSKEELDEIKRVIRYAELDVKQLSMEVVSNAVMESFANSNGQIPSAEQIYLSELSMKQLKDKAELPIDDSIFDRPLEDLKEHTQKFVWVLDRGECGTNEEVSEAEWYIHKDLEIDCLNIIDRLLTNSSTTDIQYADSVLVRCLVGHMNDIAMNSDDKKRRVVATGCVLNILIKGTNEQRKTVIDAKAISPLIEMLDSSEESLARTAVASLANIATKGTEVDVKAIVKADTIPKLVKLLEINACVTDSLQILVLAAGSNDTNISLKQPDLLPNITRLMKNKEREEEPNLILNCSILLREFLRTIEPNDIKTVMDFGVFPRLLEIISSTEDESIRTNLEQAMISIASSESCNWADLAGAGFLPILVSLADSKDDDIFKQATSAVGTVAKIKADYRDVLLSSGIMQPLLQLLKSSSSRRLLKIASLAFATCCRGEIDFDMSKNALEVFTDKLLGHYYSVDVLSNTCWALFHILEGLSIDEVDLMINIGFTQKLLNLLRSSPEGVQHAVLKSLHLLTKSGDSYIQTIIELNGMECLSQELTSSNETIQRLSCSTITNMFDYDDVQLQTAMNGNLVTCLNDMLGIDKNKKQALWTIYILTKIGNAGQVKQLITEGCVSHLCNTLTTSECNTAIQAIWSLKNILQLGKKHASVSRYTLSSGIDDIESTLEEITTETLRLERGIDRVGLLQKKKAWLKFDEQNTCVESLNDAYELLDTQQRQVKERLQSIEQKLSSVDGNSRSGQVCIKLREKEVESKTFLDNQIAELQLELAQANGKVERLYQKAEEIAPKNDWCQRLSLDDLPTDINTTTQELKELRLTVEDLKRARKSTQRRTDIYELKVGLGRLYQSVNTGKNQKRAAAMDSDFDSDDPTPTKKKSKKADSDEESSMKCPITGLFFKDPVTNRICQHTYDRAGLNQMIGAGNFTCPIPGCPNKNLNLSQVDSDEMMKSKVREHLQRRSMRNDDDDEKEYTVLE